VRVPNRSIPNFVLRVVSLFNAELRPFIYDLGYAKKTSNEKARRLLDWRPRAAREAIVAAAKSMVGIAGLDQQNRPTAKRGAGIAAT
jgi:hypothetical protein